MLESSYAKQQLKADRLEQITSGLRRAAGESLAADLSQEASSAETGIEAKRFSLSTEFELSNADKKQSFELVLTKGDLPRLNKIERYPNPGAYDHSEARGGMTEYARPQQGLKFSLEADLSEEESARLIDPVTQGLDQIWKVLTNKVRGLQKKEVSNLALPADAAF